MRNRYITEECNKILNFWKLEEYFTPSDYPELTLTIKEGKQDILFDAYYNAYSTRSLPLKEYKAHNEYLSKKHKSDEKLYNRANVYCGCYKIKTFVEKMAEKCKLDMEKYAEINELSGRFYIFSVQIDLDGKLTEEGVQISPFFYAVLCMIKSEDINVNIMQEDICKLNEDVNELLKDIKRRYSLTKRNTEEVCGKIENQYSIISTLEKKVQILEEKVYGNNESLKNKYKNNFADRYFYENIKESENSQNACPWTFDEYDMAREELFYASLQVRKAFILNSPYIKRNLFVYQAYNNGKYTIAEKQEMFPHLFNSLSVVIPVLSSTFASVGRFLKHAGNMSLGMLIIDESGQAMPQSALGALYRTRQAVVVGDPLQVEPVVTIPKVLIDILADSTGVANEYKVIENSAQTLADNMNEFNGMIGERQVGCPLVVHRRCIEPMFSISNMISYDNRMFNKTNKKEDYLKQEQPFLIKKSGWINVEGTENGSKDHFVKNQAERVCQLLESALHIYTDLFDTDDKIFIITPFRTVAESMRKFVVGYFSAKGNDKEVLKKWTKKCVGTVHTFQGKDANEVIFVLGCSDKSVGAMNWVVKKANILNVACTRAKYRIAFIGNLNDWKNRRYFREFIPKFIDTIDV